MSDHGVERETLVEMSVTYSIEVNGRFVIIEDVPARTNVDTGERFFSPETVECLQQAVWERCQPVRTIETPVYDYAALTGLSVAVDRSCGGVVGRSLTD